MLLEEIMTQLKEWGSEQTKTIFKNHGAPEPLFGVKVGDLKKIVKKIKKNHQLSIQLYQTGNSDAMYLAGLIADENQISPEQLQEWVEQASWYMLSDYTVAHVTAESPHGWEMGLKWIQNDKELIASAGWSVLSNIVSIQPDESLDVIHLEKLLQIVEKNILKSPNRVRYAMNGFVIALGIHVLSLHSKAKEIAQDIGKVEVFMGKTACKVPLASDYIAKVENLNRIGQKRKVARC